MVEGAQRDRGASRDRAGARPHARAMCVIKLASQSGQALLLRRRDPSRDPGLSSGMEQLRMPRSGGRAADRAASCWRSAPGRARCWRRSISARRTSAISTPRATASRHASSDLDFPSFTCSGRTPRPSSRAGMRRNSGKRAISRIASGAFISPRACKARLITLSCSTTWIRCVTRAGIRAAAARARDRRWSARRAERLPQQIRRRDRVLHRQVHADAADRRHRVRGIAEAQQAWPVPGREAVDRDGQQLDLVPVLRARPTRSANIGTLAARPARNASSPLCATPSKAPFGITWAHCQ